MATEYGQIGMGGSVIPSSTQIRFARGRLGQNVMNIYFTNPNKMTQDDTNVDESERNERGEVIVRVLREESEFGKDVLHHSIKDC